VTSHGRYWSHLFIFRSSWRSSSGTRTPLCTHQDIWASRSRTPKTPPRLGAPPPQGALLNHPVFHDIVLFRKYMLLTHCFFQRTTAADKASLNDIIYLLTLIGLSPGGSSTVLCFKRQYTERYETNNT